MKQIALIACSKQKLDRRCSSARACDMYQGHLFKKSVTYVEEKLDRPYFILSAQHGLVHPHQVIENYDVSMSDLSDFSYHTWGEVVTNSMWWKIKYDGVKHITFLAGADYQHPILMKLLKEMRVRVGFPLRGMRIGEQMQWLNERIG